MSTTHGARELAQTGVWIRGVSLGQQRTCDDEAQRIRGIATYNKSDGRATVETDDLISWIFSHAGHCEKKGEY